LTHFLTFHINACFWDFFEIKKSFWTLNKIYDPFQVFFFSLIVHDSKSGLFFAMSLLSFHANRQKKISKRFSCGKELIHQNCCRWLVKTVIRFPFTNTFWANKQWEHSRHTFLSILSQIMAIITYNTQKSFCINKLVITCIVRICIMMRLLENKNISQRSS
jgi:hypothetical protein